MTNKQVLIRENETLPPHVIDEVYDYVNFLKDCAFFTRVLDMGNYTEY